jgi:lactoylglutathione lyase
MAELLVNIDVGDLDAAVDFYVRALGLSVTRRLGPDVAELGGAPSPIYLTQQRAGSAPFDGAPAPRSFARHWTPVHLDFVVPELAAAIARARAAGAAVEGGERTFPGGRYAVLSDPFGNGFCLLQFVGAGYDDLARQEDAR